MFSFKIENLRNYKKTEYYFNFEKKTAKNKKTKKRKRQPTLGKLEANKLTER